MTRRIPDRDALPGTIDYAYWYLSALHLGGLVQEGRPLCSREEADAVLDALLRVDDPDYHAKLRALLALGDEEQARVLELARGKDEAARVQAAAEFHERRLSYRRDQ